MADLQQELELHKSTWSRFIKSSFWVAGGCMAILALMWIFIY